MRRTDSVLCPVYFELIDSDQNWHHTIRFHDNWSVCSIPAIFIIETHSVLMVKGKMLSVD